MSRWERKTLCGKWFSYLYTGYGMSDYNYRKPKCKKCETKNVI